MSRLARVSGRLANKPWSPSWNGYICSLPGSLEPGRLNLQPARLFRAKAVKSPACPALSSQGGYISSLPGFFEPGRLYLQPARLSRAKETISAACPALSSQGAVKSPACPALSSQGGYISSLPGSFEPGRPSLQPARLFPDLTSRTYLNIIGYETGYEALAGCDTGYATGM